MVKSTSSVSRAGSEKAVKPWKVVDWAECPDCDGGGLGCVGVQANGRLVRHSVGMGYVERVGPGTRHPTWETVICKGSGKLVRKPKTSAR